MQTSDHSHPLPLKSLLTDTEPIVSWLVPGFLPRGSLIALAGEPGAGKSLFSYTLSIGLATGVSVLNWLLQPTKVVYFDDENGRPDAVQYLKWAWHGLNQPSLPLLEQNLLVYPFHLGNKDWAKTAFELVVAAQPGLIVIDTATPSCFIQDENSNAEASSAILKLRTLMSAVSPTATCLVLKHAKLKSLGEGRRTLRGAKAWEGAVDSIVFFVRNEGHPRDDGLSGTKLIPAKRRAFGLTTTVHISPEWTVDKQGLILTRT